MGLNKHISTTLNQNDKLHSSWKFMHSKVDTTHGMNVFMNMKLCLNIDHDLQGFWGGSSEDCENPHA